MSGNEPGKLQHLVATYAPWWLRNRWIGTFLEAFAVVQDEAIETLGQGVRLGHPLRCDPSALPVISRDRGITIYPTEPIDSKRARLADWWNLHRQRGTHQGELRNLAPYFLPATPLMRIVHQNGSGTRATWHTLDSSGVYTIHKAEPSNWNWDGQTSKWARWWAILYYETALAWGEPAIWGGDPFGHVAFDGVDEGVVVPHTTDLDHTNADGIRRSYSFWIKVANGVADDSFIIGKAAAGSTWQGHGVYFDAGRPAFFLTSNITSPAKYVNRCDTALDDGAWHHVVVRVIRNAIDDYTTTWFVDNVGAASTTVANGLGNSSSVYSNPFTVAGRGASAAGDPLAGDVSAVAVFDDLLNTVEIETLYNGGLPLDLNTAGDPTSGDLVAFWALWDSDTGTGAVPSLSGSYDGQLQNWETEDIVTPTVSPDAAWNDGTLWDGGPSTAQITDIVAALKEAKSAGTRLQGVIVTRDASSFDPTASAVTDADGWTSLPVGNWASVIDHDTGLPTRPPYMSLIYDAGAIAA